MASAPQSNTDRAAAKWVRYTADNMGITQKEVGERAEIPPASIGRYWRGDVSMTLGTLQKIAGVFGVTLVEALHEIGRLEIALNKTNRK